MGAKNDRFEDLVFSIVSKHVPGLDKGSLSTRSSKAGNYLSVTVNITAHSRAQLDAIYQELDAHEQVLMLL